MTNDESFFREVEEDYRREQTVKFFKTYGSYLIAGAFVTLAIVGGYKYETQRRAAEAAKGGDALSNAQNLIDAGNRDEAEKALATLAGNGPGAYRVLARLHAAAESVANKHLESALQDYRGVVDDAAAPSALRDFARIQIAALSVDKESYESLARQLEALRSGTGEWRFAAKEILGLAAYKEGKKDEAEQLFREIMSDGEAPAGMRQRAQVMLALLLEQSKTAPVESTGTKDRANEAKTQ
jgi:hypothetical protein